MKDYNDLFYFKRQKDLISESINNIGSVKGKLSFYDNEINLKPLDDAFQELYKVYKELEVIVEEEKKNFTKEELKELHWKYKEKYEN